MLYIPGAAVPSRAANTVHVSRMVTEFEKLGLEITLLKPTLVRDLIFGATFQSFGLPEPRDIRSVPRPNFRGGERIFRTYIQILFKQYPGSSIYSRNLASTQISLSHGHPTVFEAHTAYWENRGESAEIFSTIVKCENLKGVIVISDALRKSLESFYPQIKDKIFVVRDSAPDWPCLETNRKRNKFTVGYFGSLYPGKGFEFIIKLASTHPRYNFVIFGDETEISDTARRLVPQNLKLHGYVKHTEIPDLARKADILIAPYSRSVQVSGGGGDVGKWMSPLKIFEYMALGKPIISSDLPVLREILIDDYNSLLAPPSDIFEWSNAINRLADDLDLRQRLGKSARADFERNYTWSRRAQTLVEIFDEIGFSTNG